MVTARDLPIDWGSQPSGLSLAGRIAEALASEIRRGRFGPGVKLPSSRKLADQLGVHRNTVLSALDDLESQGYTRPELGRGVFVSDQIPRAPVSRGPKKDTIGPVDFPLAIEAHEDPLPEVRPGVLALLGGLPDLRLTPVRELARAYRSALRDATVTLDYQSERGERRFLSVFGRFLAESRGVVGQEGELLVTRGSQQALYLAGRVLCRPGQVIAVESLGYPPAWQAFRLAGAELRSVRVDRGGIVLSDLERLCERHSVAAVYVTPHHQYPTTVTMSGPRRTQLLELARRKGFFVIEDDYDHEFHFEGRPVLPLASFDPARLVVHVGTLSKVFAPGLRLGYVVAQRRIVDAMCSLRRLLDRQGDHTMERALAYLIEDGVFAAHLRRMHRTYAERREVLHAALQQHLGERLSFVRPKGGLAVWARIDARVRTGRGARSRAPLLAEQWAKNAQDSGVMIQWARLLAFDRRPRNYLRLGYPRLNDTEIRSAVQILAQTYPCP